MHPIPFSPTCSILSQASALHAAVPGKNSGPHPHCPTQTTPQVGAAGPSPSSPLCWQAWGIPQGRKGRKAQCLPETTVTGTGSQHSLLINLQTTDSKDTISAMHPTQTPSHATPMSSLGWQGDMGTPQVLGNGASQSKPPGHWGMLTATPCPRGSPCALQAEGLPAHGTAH